MPILTEASQPNKRRAPVWALVLVLVLFPPVGLFGWSCYRPVCVSFGQGRLWLGTVPVIFTYNGASPLRWGSTAVELPLRLGTYYIAWESFSN